MTKDIQLTNQPLDIQKAVHFVTVPAAGAIDVFIGTTRQWTDERETSRLKYECYEEMAVAEIQRLIDECESRWPVQRVCVFHRLGIVPVAEASVVVAVSTPHRQDAFEACRYLIDELKKRVPIWKYEVYTDGSGEWVEGTHPASEFSRKTQQE